MPTPFRKSRIQLPVLGPVLLFILPLPLLPTIFIALARGQTINFLFSLLAFTLLMTAAVLTRRGLKFEAESKQHNWSRIPRLPWKTLASVCAGLGTGLCAYFVAGHPLAIALCFSVATLTAVLLTYGPDPQYSKAQGGGLFAVRDREVAQALDEATRKIEGIENANRQIRNAELSSRIRRISAKARDILSVVAQDPGDLRRARKFLKVYLDGAQRVTTGYAQMHTQQQSDVLEDNFRNVLVTIEDVFNEQHQKLLEDDLMDLDVQIEVLTTQLKREGVI